MANFYRVLAIAGKYRSVVADYDTLAEANAAIADPSITADWDSHIKSLSLSAPVTGYEAVERSV